MNHLRLFIFWLVLIFLTSCRDYRKPIKQPPSKKEVQIDSNAKLTLTEPQFVSRDSSMAQVVKLLGLGNLKNKSKEEEIRIWFGYAYSDTLKIVVLKNRGDNWQSSAYYCKGNNNEQGNIISVKRKLEGREPVSGWYSFLKELNNLGIYKLENYNKIPNYYLCNDGDEITIEVLKNKSYHIYDYPCFEVYEDKLDEVKKVKKICLLIQKEFEYRLFPRP